MAAGSILTVLESPKWKSVLNRVPKWKSVLNAKLGRKMKTLVKTEIPNKLSPGRQFQIQRKERRFA